MIDATSKESGPVIQIEGTLEMSSVDNLAGLIERLPAAASVTVDLIRARSVEPSALVQLHDLVVLNAQRGRLVLLRGITLAQARLLDLARSGQVRFSAPDLPVALGNNRTT
jgi:hypothetical protein